MRQPTSRMMGPPLRGPEVWTRRPRRPADRRLPAVYRLLAGDDGTPAAVADELARDSRLGRAEAALFAADEPLTPRRLAAAAQLADVAEARRLVARLRDLYDRDGTAFQIADVAGGWQLLTRPEFHVWLGRLPATGTPGYPALPHSVADLKLSGAVRETLAVIAYRQPVTRADVEAVRGVQCGQVIEQLMEKGLVRISGRDDSLGRPMLYATTKKFLQAFGFNSLKDLPAVGDLAGPAGATERGES